MTIPAFILYEEGKSGSLRKHINKELPCVYCGWALGEREGEPLCNRCDFILPEKEKLNE